MTEMQVFLPHYFFTSESEPWGFILLKCPLIAAKPQNITMKTGGI